MARKSSTAKGDAFEDVFRHKLEADLAAGLLPYDPSCCRVFSKKGYFSPARDNEIVFDVAVELWRPGASTFGALVLYECKDLARPVSVNEVEVFWAQVKQIGSVGVKGVVVSRNGFQEGALSFARRHRIGLVQLHPESDLKWILERTVRLEGEGPRDLAKEVITGLTNPAPRVRHHLCDVFDGSTFSHSLNDLFVAAVNGSGEEERALLRQIRVDRVACTEVEFLPAAAIDGRVSAIVRAVGYTSGEVDLGRVGVVYGGAPPRVILDAAPSPAEIASGVHGRISFEPLEIVVYETATRPRKRFTLAHELGHLVLRHSRYFVSERFAHEDLGSFGERGLAATSMQRLEWQANYFANALLMPDLAFHRCFARVARQVDLRDRGHGLLYVDAQPANLQTLHHVLPRRLDDGVASQDDDAHRAGRSAPRDDGRLVRRAVARSVMATAS